MIYEMPKRCGRYVGAIGVRAISADLRARTGLIEGRGACILDVFRSDALWIHAVRSDLAHGGVKGLDAVTASRLEGVSAFLTEKDPDDVPRIPVRVGPTPRLETRLQPVLAVDHIANAVVDAPGPNGDSVITRLPLDRQSKALSHAAVGSRR